MDQFIVGHTIGEGQFGCIREAIVKETGNPVVLKIIRVTRLAEGLPHPIAREVLIAPRMDHPYVVRTYQVFPVGTSMVLVMERCASTVAKLLSQHSPRNPIPLSYTQQLLGMLLSAVEYIHTMGVLHRDIKPANCLLTRENVLKVGDFGLSRLREMNKDMSHEVQSRWYRAPELLLGQRRYGGEIDIWSVGCVAAELIRGYGCPLFCGDGDIRQLSLIFDVLGTPDEEAIAHMPDWSKIQFGPKRGLGIGAILPTASAVMVDFLKCMLCLNPKKRLSATELLRHPFFMVTTW